MCTVALKKFKDVGWIGCKNRDRNYKCEIEIVQSNRDDIQRLYIDDKTSRWTEGLNEYGISILSASFSVKSDEKEGDKVVSKRKANRRESNYYAPDGKTVRTALLEKDIKKALQILIDRELAGATFVFNDKDAYLLEGGFTVRKEDASKDNPREYIHKVYKLKDDDVIVRTNHGILLKQLGYKEDPEDEYYARARKSSERRYEIALNSVKKLSSDDPTEMINAIAVSPDKDPFMNPVRRGDTSKGEMVTTGQLLINPSEKTLHYRPIYSKLTFEYDKLNHVEAKTFFEVISSKKLLGFREWTSQ